MALHRKEGILSQEANNWKSYEVIAGKIANDNTNRVITGYINGLYGEVGSESADNIAKSQKISKVKAFMRFMKSKTAEMLFDESTYMWMNGPDYIADEYRREKKAIINTKKGDIAIKEEYL